VRFATRWRELYRLYDFDSPSLPERILEAYSIEKRADAIQDFKAWYEANHRHG